MSQREEGIYRRVTAAMWGDEHFLGLSPLPPSGQSLWLWLLTGPCTTNLPGLIRSGRAACAEELGWDQADFDRCFAELERAGMARADWRVRLIWLPNAVRHNPPNGPNTVASWRQKFDLLPQCELRTDAERAIVSFLEQKGPAFAAAFARPAVVSTPERELPPAPVAVSAGTGLESSSPPTTPSIMASDMPSHMASDMPSIMPSSIQEQDQEQEDQDPETPRAPARGATPAGGSLVSRRRLHCEWESPNGLDVPRDLHDELRRRLLAAGRSREQADAELLAFYAQVDKAVTAQGTVIAESAYPFWRARFREQYGAPSGTRRPNGRRDVPAAPPRPAAARGTDAWAALLRKLENSPITQHERLKWFGHTRLVADRGQELEVAVPDTETATWIERHYRDHISTACAAIGRPETTVTYTVPS